MIRLHSYDDANAHDTGVGLDADNDNASDNGADIGPDNGIGNGQVKVSMRDSLEKAGTPTSILLMKGM